MPAKKPPAAKILWILQQIGTSSVLEINVYRLTVTVFYAERYSKRMAMLPTWLKFATSLNSLTPVIYRSSSTVVFFNGRVN